MVAILQSPGTPTQADFHEAISNRSDRKIREEALFWLGQSDSDEAFAVLDRLLSGTM